MAIARGIKGPFNAYRLTATYRVQRIHDIKADERGWWYVDYVDAKGREYRAVDLYRTAADAYDAGHIKLNKAKERIDKARERILKRAANLDKPEQVRK